ncbi:hypothetical protein LTR86_002885 [Recurvomyces mirabilis]|nr:hypothetical protein LTR86_002885 [Recurvomyces mirabilis]
MDNTSFALQRQQSDQLVEWCSPTNSSQHFTPRHPPTPPRLPPTYRNHYNGLSPAGHEGHAHLGGPILPQMPMNQIPLTHSHSYEAAPYPTLFPQSPHPPQRFTSGGYPSPFDDMHTRATAQGFPPANRPMEHAAGRRASHPVHATAAGVPQHNTMHMRGSMPDVPTLSAFARNTRHQNPAEAVIRPLTAQHVPYHGASLQTFEPPALPMNNVFTPNAHTLPSPAATTSIDHIINSTETTDRPSSNHSTEEIIVSSQTATNTVQPPTTKALMVKMPHNTSSSDKENSTPADVPRKKSSSSSQASASAAGSMMAEGVKSRKRSQVMRFGQESATATPPPPTSSTRAQKSVAPAKDTLNSHRPRNNHLTAESKLSQTPKAIESRIYRTAKLQGATPEETRAMIAAARAAGDLPAVRVKTTPHAASAAEDSDIAGDTDDLTLPSGNADTITADAEASEQAAKSVNTKPTKRSAGDDTVCRRSSKRLRATPASAALSEQQSSFEAIDDITHAIASGGVGADADAANDTITPVSRSTQHKRPRASPEILEDAQPSGQEDRNADDSVHRDPEDGLQTQHEPLTSDGAATPSSTPARRRRDTAATRRKSRIPELSLGQTSLDAEHLQQLRDLARNGENLDWTGIEDHSLRATIFRKAINRRTVANKRRSQIGDAAAVVSGSRQERPQTLEESHHAAAHSLEVPAAQHTVPVDVIQHNNIPPANEPSSLQPEAEHGNANVVEPSVASAPKFAQSLVDIQKYSAPGEDLDWTKETDKQERLRKQHIITRRKSKDPNRQPVYTGRTKRSADASRSEDATFSSSAAPTSASARSKRHKDKRSYADDAVFHNEVDTDEDGETPAPQVQELKMSKVEFTDGTFADIDFVESLKLVLANKGKSSGFPGRQAKRIMDLLNVAEPPRTGEALWLVTPDQAAKWLAPGQYFDGPIVVHGQQILPLQSIDDFLGEHFDDSIQVSIQDPSTYKVPHVRDVTMRQVKERFSQPVTGNPWNLLELATHREDGLRPAFLNTSECSLLTKVKLPGSGDTASRRGFTDGWKEVEKWTLVAQAGALTEPHQDSHGYSTYISVNQGVVGFGWLSKPTAGERAGWCGHHDSYIGGRWRYVILRPGMTVYFPAGTVHFVFRHPDAGNTLAFGGHVLRCSQIVRWINVLLQESAIPNVTNEDLSLSAPGYLKSVEKFVKQALKTGQMEKWGGKESIESFLEKKKEFEKLQVEIAKKKRAIERSSG